MGAIIAGMVLSLIIICGLQCKGVRDFCQAVVIYQIPFQRYCNTLPCTLPFFCSTGSAVM